MTFGNLVFRLRRRSQDLRQSNGDIITDLTVQNGLRWSAQDIVDFCNDAINDALRLVLIYPTSPIAQRLAQNLLIVRDVELTFTDNLTELDYQYIGVLGLYDKQNKLEYLPTPPERLSTFTDSGLLNVSDSRWYTVTKSYTSLKLVIAVNKAPTNNKLYATLVARSPVFGANATDFAKEIPLQGVDELVEVLAELKLRTAEGYFERVNQLISILKIYLGVGSNG